MLKNRILLLLGVVVCFYVACKQDPPYDYNAQAAIDDLVIKKYLSDNNITAQKTPEGLYYTIINQGTGTSGIALKDSLIIHYVGRLVPSGTVIDSTSVVYNPATITAIDSTQLALLTKLLFNDAMPGWQIGLQKLNVGGKIRLIIPSTLAFQNRPIGSILNATVPTPVPANSVLDFDIDFVRLRRK